MQIRLVATLAGILLCVYMVSYSPGQKPVEVLPLLATEVLAAEVPDSPIDFGPYDAAEAEYQTAATDFRSQEAVRADALSARDAAQQALDAAQAALDTAQSDLEAAADVSQAAWVVFQQSAEDVGLAPPLPPVPAAATRKIRR